MRAEPHGGQGTRHRLSRPSTSRLAAGCEATFTKRARLLSSMAGRRATAACRPQSRRHLFRHRGHLPKPNPSSRGAHPPRASLLLQREPRALRSTLRSTLRFLSFGRALSSIPETASLWKSFDLPRFGSAVASARQLALSILSRIDTAAAAGVLRARRN